MIMFSEKNIFYESYRFLCAKWQKFKHQKWFWYFVKFGKENNHMGHALQKYVPLLYADSKGPDQPQRKHTYIILTPLNSTFI